MGINNINTAFFNSDYRINNIPKVDVSQAEPKVDQIQTPVQESINVSEKQDKPSIDIRPIYTDPKSVSLTFNKNDDFGYIGKDSDINSLDMRKAISTMEQDSMFKQYQYFVGSSADIFSSEDGRVVAK